MQEVALPPVNLDRVMSLPTRLCPFILAGALALLAVVVAASPAAAQEESIVVEAEQIVYDQTLQRIDATGNVRIRYRGVLVRADQAVVDLREERLQATGNVVLTDASGRTVRGQTLLYDFRAQRAEISPAATTIDGVHVRGDRVVAEPERIVGEGAMFTTCDPEQPAYRVTATRVEVVPGERLVAHQATLWLGSVRLFTLPQLTISLRTAEATARSFPRAGYTPGEGLWVEYGVETPIGGATGRAYARVGTHSAQGGLQLLQYRIGTSGASFSALLQAGWLRNSWSTPLISRIQYRLQLDIPQMTIAPNLTWQAAVSWVDSFYGTGSRQSIARAQSLLAYHLDPTSALRLRVVLTSVSGHSPFFFENLAARERPLRIALEYSRRSERSSPVLSDWQVGVIFHLRNGTTSVRGEYGQRVGDRYHWRLGAQYNLVTHGVRLSTDVGFAITPRTYFTVEMDYNVTRARFKNVDLLLRSRICDCIGVAFRYRVIQQEIWLEVGLLPPAPPPVTTDGE